MLSRRPGEGAMLNELAVFVYGPRGRIISASRHRP
jgi:hypothetical protein